MNRCLFVTEIVQIVCDEIHADGDADSLYALAQTSHHSHEPALAGLWKEIPDIIPIIKSAGRDLWHIHTENHAPILAVTFNSPIRRYSNGKYGRFLRRFGFFYQYFAETSVAPDVWDALRSVFGGTALFSNIQGIIFNEEKILESIALFSIRNLASIWFECDAAPHAHMLAGLFARCPNLKRVDCGGLAQVKQQKEVVQALANWPDLIQFVASDLSLKLFRTLSECCSSLRHLAFNHLVPSDNILYQLKPTTEMEALTFPVLEQASFSLCNFSSATAFLDHFPAGENLETLSITIHEFGPYVETDWLRLLQSIKNHYPHSLKRLRIGEWHMRNIDSDSDNNDEVDNGLTLPQLSYTLISVLATGFKMLTAIDIMHLGGYDIVDEDLKLMTESLPLLEIFCLVDGADCAHVEFKNTIASLLYFARNCPVLIHLGLGLDGRADKVPQLLDCSIRSSSLKVLDVSASPLDDPYPVAKFLAAVFPNLQDIRYVDEQELNHDPELGRFPWYGVFEILIVEESM